MLLLLGFVARSMTWTWIVYGVLYVLFGIILVVQYRSKFSNKNIEAALGHLCIFHFVKIPVINAISANTTVSVT